MQSKTINTFCQYIETNSIFTLNTISLGRDVTILEYIQTMVALFASKVCFHLQNSLLFSLWSVSIKFSQFAFQEIKWKMWEINSNGEKSYFIHVFFVVTIEK